MRRVLLSTALSLILSILGPAASRQDADRLTEPREMSANAIQPPKEVMNIIGVRPGLVVGEVGAGRGRVTVHLADRIGAAGKIYANDIDARALEYLKHRCERLGLANVETVLGLVDDARFPANSLDLVFMAWVFHHVEKPVPLLKSLLPSLKPWGSVVMVEPDPAHTEPGGRALTRDLIEREAREAGFELAGTVEGRLKEDNIFILRPVAPETPDSRDPRKVRALWLEFLEWGSSSPAGLSLRGYAENLDKLGLDAGEIRRRLQVLRGQYTEQPEGIEMIYDPLYGKPLTGELEKDGFKTAPNAFLVEAMKTFKPGGRALDVGAGMGRNGVYLAKLGWNVTGIDLSARGLAVMKADAEQAGVKVETVKTSYEDYDFGKERWDLVAMILSWAPIEDPGFLARLKASIKPGGHLVFEHVTQRAKDPFPPGVHALPPGALRALFKDFEILVYRELDDYGDWGGPPTGHVRMVARKRG
jgi:2-polyprenyl-3-methyl-5-hydroxy-6-metoxy-1,4-benzoquinol methylase